jgi:hypothetical protein
MSILDAVLPAPIHEAGILWPENVKHVSASSLKTFAACPEQYRQRYVLGIKTPPAAALAWGTADHAAAEHNYRQKIETHLDVATLRVQEVFLESIEKQAEDAGGPLELEWSKLDGKAVKTKAEKVAAWDTVRARGQELSAAYHEKVAPLVQPLTVEERFETQIEGVPVPLIGYRDLVGEPSEQANAAKLREPAGDVKGVGVDTDPTFWKRIIDRKTAGKKVSKPESDWTLQAGLYQLDLWLPYEWQISVKTKDPYVIAGDPALTVKATEGRRRWVTNAVRSLLLELGWMHVTFGADEPWPATRALLHQWRCSYCGYYDECTWVKT